MQILEIEKDGKKVASKPFDFEAMCLIDDARNRDQKAGVLRLGIEAVSHLFEGTGISDRDIDALSPAERAWLSETVWKWYVEALSTPKNA